MKEKLKDYKSKIDRRLRNFLEERVRRVKNISPAAKEMMEHVLEFNLRGGKRIRPILVILGFQSCGGKNDEIYDAALAVELMESYLLIHDDIMDQDDIRRGYLSMHKVYENKLKRKYGLKDAKRYGESMAMIAGDILAVLGTEALLDTSFNYKLKLKAIERFNRAVVNTCFGQALDIGCSISKNLCENDISQVNKLKTAIYTFEAPLQIGAILANAKKNDLEVLSRYAIPLGMAFQLQDDILGLYGTRQKIGKPVASDIREGKRTILIQKAIELASKSEGSFIESCLGNRQIIDKDISRLRQIVKECGALDYVKEKSRLHTEEAILVMAKSNLKSPGKKDLIELSEYILNREH